MTILYIFLLSILILFYGAVFNKLARSSQLVTPLMGWVVGISFFIIAPLSILVLNGGYQIPFFHGVAGGRGDVDLND